MYSISLCSAHEFEPLPDPDEWDDTQVLAVSDSTPFRDGFDWK